MGGKFVTLVRVLLERRAQERSCRWTQRQLESHQTRCVAALRQYALAHSPFYRNFHRGYETRPLQELPILTKGMMMERFDDLVTDRRLRLADLEDFLRSDESDGLSAERAVRAAIEPTGARVPSINVRCDSTLERGRTGKAPLIIARKSDSRGAPAS